MPKITKPQFEKIITKPQFEQIKGLEIKSTDGSHHTVNDELIELIINLKENEHIGNYTMRLKSLKEDLINKLRDHKIEFEEELKKPVDMDIAKEDGITDREEAQRISTQNTKDFYGNLNRDTKHSIETIKNIIDILEEGGNK